jgi:hypothetical protein
MTEVLEQYGVNILQAATTGAFSFGISYAMYNDRLINTNMMPIAKLAAVAAASEVVAAVATDQLLPTLAGMSTMDGNMLRMYTGPLLSGLIYSYTTDSVIKNLDGRSFFEKFVTQVGASVLAGYVTVPAYKSIEGPSNTI